MSGKLIGAPSIEGNPISEIAELKRRMADAEDGTVNAATLSDITPHAGQLQDLDILVNEDFGGDLDVNFVTNDGKNVGGLDIAHVDSAQTGVRLFGKAKTSSESGYAALFAANDDETAEYLLYVNSDGFALVGTNAAAVQVHHGTQVTYNKVVSTTETPIASTVVGANMMGANGRIGWHGFTLVKNNKGSAGTYDIKVYFGSKSFTIASGASINNSATTRRPFEISVEVVNCNATNAQNIIVTYDAPANVAAETQVASSKVFFWTTATEDTTANVTFKITIDLSVTDANFFAETSGEFSGPHKAVA